MQENNFYENSGADMQGATPAVAPTKGSFFKFGGLSPELKEEKNGIKRAANCLAVSFLIFLALSSGWSYAYVFVTDLLGISRIDAAIFLRDPAFLQVMSIFLSGFLFTVPFIIFYLVSGYRISDLVILKRPKKGMALPCFLIGIAFCSFANITTGYSDWIFSLIGEAFGINYTVGHSSIPDGVFGLILFFIATAAVPAMVEEFACRGLLLGSLKKYGEGFAILTSALIFGIMHGNFDQMPFAFLVGLVLGFITVKSGTMWVAIAVHAFNNSVSVLFSFLANNVSAQIQNISYIIFLCVVLFFGILGLFLLNKADSGFFKLSNMQTVSSEGQKYRWFFLRPLVLLFIGLCIYDSVSYFVKW